MQYASPGATVRRIRITIATVGEVLPFVPRGSHQTDTPTSYETWDVARRRNIRWNEKDNDGNYSPENCVWATHAEQMRNTSKSIFLTLDGRTEHLMTWAAELGIPAAVLRRRRRDGWSDKKLLTAHYL